MRLHAAMVDAVVAPASSAEQLALLRAHPDLGRARRMSDASSGEQAGAGLDSLTRDEFERLHALNAAYREKFGFPFLLCGEGRTKHDILNALERRLTSPRDEEHRGSAAPGLSHRPVPPRSGQCRLSV